jgi:hypothetical protein
MSAKTTNDSAGVYKEVSPAAYGVSVFAGVVLATLSSFQFLEGLAAVLKDDLFVKGAAYAYQLDVTAWGWIHLILGLIGIAVGVGILTGQVWAFIGGLIFAFVSALTQFMFLPYYPFWAVLVIGLDVLVIWALANRLTAD